MNGPKPGMVFLLVITSFLIGACASRLVISPATGNPGDVKGIRVYSPVAYVLQKRIETEKCPERLEESIVHLPRGDAYDVNFAPAWFAKSEFSVILGDNGASLKQVTLNSTPQLAETLTALATLTKELAGAVKPAALAQPDKCGAVTSETVVTVRRLQIKE